MAQTRTMAPATRWRASVAALVAVACVCSYSPPLVAGDQKFLKAPLQKLQHSSQDIELRLTQQQARVRRRTQEVISNSNGDFALGAVALSEAPLGVGYGTHYAEIYLGIPAQRASVIVDTGSHFTALPCSSCNGCGTHTDPLFDMTKSTTAKYLACHDFDSCNTCQEDRCYISQRYMEGSMWQAVVVDELVWVGGFSSRSDEMEGFLKTFGFRFPVGCQTKETGLFITQKENGIMGLGRHRSTVMSYMLNAGRVAQNLFTLCFAGDGGEIVFGGVDYGHHTSDVGYTPLLDDTSAFYPVHVKSVSVNDKRLDIDESTLNSGRGVIVDSGTTDTFFDAKGKRNFMSAFKEAAGRDYSESRMQLSEDELAALPVISIVLSGMSGNGSDDVQLDIPASKYLTPDNNGYYYGNFHFSERSGGVLGASVMVGYDVIFDMEHKRIGFADSNCGKGYANRSSNGAADTTPTNTPVATPNSSFITPIDLSGPNATIEPTGSTVEIPGSSATTTTSGPLATTTDGSNTTATVFAGTVDSTDVNKGSTLGGSTSRSSPAIGAFIAEVIIISLVGIALAVVVWTRWRMRSWSRIPETTPTARAHTQSGRDDVSTGTLCSPSRELVLSPRSRARQLSPKFTIGSSGEEDEVGGELRIDTEADSSPSGRPQGERTRL